MTGRWEVRVDRYRCQGSGMCVGSAPDYFGLDGGRSQPLAGTVDPDDVVLSAAECCPMEAISVSELDTGRQLFPE